MHRILDSFPRKMEGGEKLSALSHCIGDRGLIIHSCYELRPSKLSIVQSSCGLDSPAAAQHVRNS